MRHGLMNDANRPNIDQRLDRLTERHEALTQTVELIAAAQLKSDERLGQVTADIAKLAALMSQTDKFINRLAQWPTSSGPTTSKGSKAPRSRGLLHGRQMRKGRFPLCRRGAPSRAGRRWIIPETNCRSRTWTSPAGC